MTLPKSVEQVLVWAAFATLTGCASNHAVKCDAHLVPINPPPPKVVPTPDQQAKPSTDKGS